ncbi:MAG: Flp pilus assembly complex ATPase component TadA [Acidobacteriia bacterium]|nr:Flp pilus assembly complex ATPase component TadA [Terriglobia bacterium]
MSWETIVPFLRPIEFLILDPDVSDILVNASGRVFVERFGQLQEVPGVILSEKNLRIAVRHIARALDSDINEEKPLLDARLPDGSRVAAVYSPCSVNGTTLAIRKFQSKRYTADELVRVGTLTPELLLQLRTAVELHQNILIAGSTGAGKTTLLNALASFIDPTERVIVIEDTAEIQIEQANLVRLEARREQPDLPAVTIRDLLKATLRLRPDRILLGEVRGGEAFDLLQALNTGHSGTLSTIHANSAQLAVSRFATCVLVSHVELPHKAIRASIAESLDLVIHLGRRKDKRIVTEFLRIKRYDSAQDLFEFEKLYGCE